MEFVESGLLRIIIIIFSSFINLQCGIIGSDQNSQTQILLRKHTSRENIMRILVKFSIYNCLH